MVNNKKVSDSNVIANGFGSYFANIGKQSAEAIPRSMHPSEYYTRTEPNKHTIFMNPTDTYEIAKILGSCKTKKHW